MIETAARNQLLRWRGRHSAAEFTGADRPRRRRAADARRPRADDDARAARRRRHRALRVRARAPHSSVLEDLGFYCIDNLPVALLPRFLELWESSREDVGRVALGIDVRERRFLHDVPRVFDELRAARRRSSR